MKIEYRRPRDPVARRMNERAAVMGRSWRLERIAVAGDPERPAASSEAEWRGLQKRVLADALEERLYRIEKQRGREDAG